MTFSSFLWSHCCFLFLIKVNKSPVYAGKYSLAAVLKTKISFSNDSNLLRFLITSVWQDAKSMYSALTQSD